ncbi:MAG: hypothetical protein J0H64_03090, partial [Actinobacteria bacterium]|nr:hypothetical protein [Actinomycetota bacterium]
MRTHEEYETVLADAGSVFAFDSQVPDWVFRERAGTVTFCEEGSVLDDRFLPVIKALADRYGDRKISVVAKDFFDRKPSMRRVYDGRFKAFTMPTDAGLSPLGPLLDYGPLLEPDTFDLTTPTFQYEDIVVIFGDSGQWGVYRDMGWEIALLWVNVDEPFWPQLPGHYFTNARGGSLIASPTFYARDDFETESKRLIDTYAPFDPWRNSPLRKEVDLAACRAWLQSRHALDSLAWAYTQEVIWSSAAAWDLVPGGSAWAVPVDFERFDLEAIMNWLGDRYATGPEPWLEAQALIFDLMTEKIE